MTDLDDTSGLPGSEPGEPHGWRRPGAWPRWAKLTTGGVALLAVLVVVVVVVAFAGGGGEDDARVRSGDARPRASVPTTTASTTPGTTTQTATTTPAVQPTTIAPEPGEPEPEPVEPEPVCRNSYDERCGPFFWDPPLVNQPLVVTVNVSATTVDAGTPIEVTVDATDPDAEVADCPPSERSYTTEHDSLAVGNIFYPDPMCPTYDPPFLAPNRFGPWDPPPPGPPSERTWTFTITFTTPGTKTLQVHIASAPFTPYGNSFSREYTIDVT